MTQSTIEQSRSVVPKDYIIFLKGIKERILSSQVKAALAVNRELVALYWEIGATVYQKQQIEGWGANENGWSRNVLLHWLDSGLYKRQGKAINNFQATLPSPQSDLAHQTLKDPYCFDFLALKEKFDEKELEDGLLEHIQKFLLELGAGFSFVGRQYPLKVSDKEFLLDLLFYHLKLRCFVIVELKAKEFSAKDAGQMNFYLSVVDDRLRQPGDNPSIGLLLCKTKDRLIAEYALRDTNKPIGIAEYERAL